jgi:hypothetical protein
VNPRQADRSDEGAVLIWVALMMVVLLGVGALVIDIGALYLERRELQNGADAAALAVAQDCVGAGDCYQGSRAKEYADLNAEKDDVSAVDPATPCGKGPNLKECAGGVPSGAERASGWVQVTTVTETADGGSEVSFVLAPIIGALTGKAVDATAVAAWGPMRTGTVFPFTVSVQCFDAFEKDEDGFPLPEPVTIFSKQPKDNPGGGPKDDPGGGPKDDPGGGPCSSAPSGGTAAGGFGWIGGDESCAVSVEVGKRVPGDPGNDNVLKKCGLEVQNQEVLIPLFSSVDGTGNNAGYTISGFVGFQVTGYQLTSEKWGDTTGCGDVGNNGRCFRGTFTRYYSGIGEFADEGSRDFGARVIKMVG